MNPYFSAWSGMTDLIFDKAMICPNITIVSPRITNVFEVLAPAPKICREVLFVLKCVAQKGEWNEKNFLFS